MTAEVPPAEARLGFAHQMATRAAFLVAGLVVSCWAPLIPYAKERLALSDGQLGGLLLCLGAGSVIGMPSAGALAGRFGCRIVIVLTGLLCATMLPVLATGNQVWMIAAALLLFGAGLGMLDVTMNIQAVIVENASGRPMMSGFHGLYSVGGIIGAGLISLLISQGASPLGATGAAFAVVVLLLATNYRALLPYGGASGGPAFVLPRGVILLLGLFCFVLFLAEGSVLDWSAVFLTTVRHADESHAGLGYVAFSTAMTVCRLTGDTIVRWIGPARIVFLGGLCAAGGFILAISVPSTTVGIVGFSLVGVGCSNAVPVMFTAAGRQTFMPTNLAIAAITTMGYAGILIGPAMVGLFSQFVGLPLGLSVVALMLIAVSIASPKAKLGATTPA